jgi:hypothetical protein
MNQAVRKRPTMIGNFKERKTAGRRCGQPTNRRNGVLMISAKIRSAVPICCSPPLSAIKPDRISARMSCSSCRPLIASSTFYSWSIVFLTGVCAGFESTQRHSFCPRQFDSFSWRIYSSKVMAKLKDSLVFLAVRRATRMGNPRVVWIRVWMSPCL